MPDLEPSSYEDSFRDIIHSLDELINSPEYQVLGSDEQKAPSVIVKAFGNYIAKKLKQNPDPGELLQLIEIIDKVYFQCLMKNNQRLLAQLFFDLVESAINDTLSNGLAPVEHQVVHELRQNHISELRVRVDYAFFCAVTA